MCRLDKILPAVVSVYPQSLTVGKHFITERQQSVGLQLDYLGLHPICSDDSCVTLDSMCLSFHICRMCTAL